MAVQLHLFRPPRRPAVHAPRTLHVIDAGDVPGFEPHGGVRFQCEVCGHQTDWLKSRGDAIEIKGRVCPRCRGDANRDSMREAR